MHTTYYTRGLLKYLFVIWNFCCNVLYPWWLNETSGYMELAVLSIVVCIYTVTNVCLCSLALYCFSFSSLVTLIYYHNIHLPSTTACCYCTQYLIRLNQARLDKTYSLSLNFSYFKNNSLIKKIHQLSEYMNYSRIMME